jgi:hypothetical protein
VSQKQQFFVISGIFKLFFPDEVKMYQTALHEGDVNGEAGFRLI